MAIIPLNQKFHTINNSVVTKERGSALVNSQKDIFVTQDIIDTVSANMSIPVLNTYPVTTPASAGTKFVYRGNEWEYMTQAEINSIGWTGLVSVGFPAPVSKVYENTILYVGTDIPATDISFNAGFGSYPIKPMEQFNKNFTIDFLGLGNPAKWSVFVGFGGLLNSCTITFRNVQLLAGLKNFGTTSAIGFNYAGLTAQALNDFFTALPPTTFTATLNFQNNPGSATCTPSIATSKGYTVIV
jgi:hypothetical protein